MPADDGDRLADSIETASTDLIAELKSVRDSVEELYVLLDHIWRNREELHDIMAGLLEERAEQSEDDQTVACRQCDALQASLAGAVQQGWTDFRCDDRGDGTYVAICHDCQEKHDQRTTLAAQMGLAPTQIRQAVAEDVTTAVGLRRIEKNTRADDVPESISCARCDADSPPSLAAALQEGWIELCRDDGPSWNYLGICPECQAQDRQTPLPESEQADEQGRLFV